MCLGSWLLRKGESYGSILCFERTVPNQPRFLFLDHYWWWNMVLWLWPQNQTTFKLVEDCNIALPQKSLSSEIKHQNNAQSTFFNVRGVVHSKCIPLGQTVNQGFYLEILRRLCNNVGKKGLIYGKLVTGFSIMTMHMLI